MIAHSASAMARQIRKGEISAQDLVAQHLKQIEAVNGQLNAAVSVFAEEALAAAQEADAALARGDATGPLHGVPFSIKDSIDVRGHRTTAGTAGRRECAPATRDATLVARLRAAGGIPIAKTNLPDLLFAYESDNLLFGRTNNPYDTRRTSGGSSGGESALIAAGGSPFGLGSDAAGSVRVPAAFCGIASLKPTSGRLPRTGHVPGASGWIEALWAIGPMARHVEDLELAMSVMAGGDGMDVASPLLPWAQELSGRPLRVAYYTDNGFAACSTEACSAVERAAGVMASAGMHVEERRAPGVAEAFDLEMDLLGADGGDGIDSYLKLVGSQQQHWLLHGGFLDRLRKRRCTMERFTDLWMRWDAYRARMAKFFTEFDAVLCPIYTEAALLHGQSAEAGKFEGFSHTMAWNVAGCPAAVVRCGETGELPIGVQVATGRWHDARALQLCRLIEQELGGWSAPPQMP